MVIVLKVICFSLWMIIMLFLIKGSRQHTIARYRELKVSVQDDDDIEMLLCKVGLRLGLKDRFCAVSPFTISKNLVH